MHLIEPVGIAQATGKSVGPVAGAILDYNQALLIPGLAALQVLVSRSMIGGSTA
jgi:hypothetical protein